ncbi:hypothetical protein V6N12_055077 [Hibiscus sabdariffa]|uniref:Uncharacterized protein n=1 Tax=Hibiscus sabdariffa TaxID=183260 RepID=A0ABR1ZDT7_9ROSI
MAEESQQSKSKMVEYDPGFDRIIRDFLENDNKVAFVKWIHYQAHCVGGYDVYQSLMLPDILLNINVMYAVKCATALLQGETGLKLDIYAQYTIMDVLRPVDLRPLEVAIWHMSEQPPFIGWSTRQSLYMTIVICQCDIEMLDKVRLLFRATNEVEKEIYDCVMFDKLIGIAALLTVAREEVLSPSLFKGLGDPALNESMSLRQLVLSEIVSLMASEITLFSTSEEDHDKLNDELEIRMSMLRLIEVFERVRRPTTSSTQTIPFFFIPTPGLQSHPTQQPPSGMTIRWMPTSQESYNPKNLLPGLSLDHDVLKCAGTPHPQTGIAMSSSISSMHVATLRIPHSILIDREIKGNDVKKTLK